MTKSLTFTEDELFVILRCMTSCLINPSTLSDQNESLVDVYEKVLHFLLGKT